MNADKIIVALDLPNTQAIALAKQLQGQAKWLKVGMSLFYEAGPSIVEELKNMGYAVFLDLKLFDIPHQVELAVGKLATLGADLLTVHALGGAEMIKTAVAAADKSTQIIAVTILTSFDQALLNSQGFTAPVADIVNTLATQSIAAGAAGVVASPQELSKLRTNLGSDPIIITPGIRPISANSLTDDQKRISTPGQALADGASYLVIGRPISGADDPVQSFVDIAKNQ